MSRWRFEGSREAVAAPGLFGQRSMRRGARRSAVRTVASLCVATAACASAFAFAAFRSPSGALQSTARAGVRMLARGGDDDEDEDEVDVWKAAYDLEDERAGLMAKQMKGELERLGQVGEELAAEFEGCLVEFEDTPGKPSTDAASEWAEAYSAIRRCNEQAELKLIEIRTKFAAKMSEEKASTSYDVSGDFGPIRYKGIVFKDIVFPRMASDTGSKAYFVELEMPLGLRLEETIRRNARGLLVTEVGESGSAFKDGTVRVGDVVRAITVPQRRLQKQEGDEEESGTLGDALGISAGEMTKAMLVIPPDTNSFPFDRILGDIQKNQQVDSYVGLVVERPMPAPESKE